MGQVEYESFFISCYRHSKMHLCLAYTFADVQYIAHYILMYKCTHFTKGSLKGAWGPHSFWWGSTSIQKPRKEIFHLDNKWVENIS